MSTCASGGRLRLASLLWVASLAVVLALPVAGLAAPSDAPSADATAAGLGGADGLGGAPSDEDLAASDQGGRKPDADAEKAGDELASLDTLGLFQRAGEVQAELKELEQLLVLPPEIHTLSQTLPMEVARLDKEVSATLTDIKTAHRWYIVTDVRFRFAQERMQLSAYRAPLQSASVSVASIPKRVDDIVAEWSHAQESLIELGAAEETRARVGEVLRAARLVRFRARRLEAKLAKVSSLINHMSTGIDSVLAGAENDAPSILSDWRNRGLTPLQAVREFPSLPDATRSIGDTLKNRRETFVEFAALVPGRVFLNLLIILGCIWALIRGRRHHLSESGDENLERMAYEHPIAGGVLTGAIATIFLYQFPPSPMSLLAIAMGCGASAVILMKQHQKGKVLIGGGTLLLLFFTLVQPALLDVPQLEYLVLGLEGLVVGAVAWFLLRGSSLELSGAWAKLGRAMARVWLVCAAIGLLAWSIGFADMANVLIDGSVRLMLITITFRSAYGVIASLIDAGMASDFLRSINAVRNHGPLLAARTNLVLRLLLLFLWGRGLLNAYTLRGWYSDSWTGLWEASFSVGSLELSTGDVVTLAVGIATAILAAKLVQFMLEEDFLPRTKLRIGTRAAVSSGVYYLLLSFGLFLALAASGMHLDRLAILVSALGVGIGFGLQNIVQNFVAGLILIFGRPINVRDVVQVGDLIGRVTKVGFRASTVRTFQGAEVIVPNSAFVSDQVINWSLSDENRRVELDVGVAYGTDTEKVLEILLKVASDNPEVVKYPETEAIFVEFGDSSLNFQLRAWTDNGARWPNIKSDLAIAIDNAFKQADIEIPFPQRDLHLRSVDADAGNQLGGNGTSRAESPRALVSQPANPSTKASDLDPEST